MKMVRGYKTELAPNNAQRTLLLKHAGTARFAYNWGLARKIAAYQTGEKVPSAIDLHRDLNALKPTELSWMYEVSKCAPQEALRDLDRAYANFFRKVKLKKAGKWKGKLGFPKFKKKSKAIGSFRLTGSIHIDENSAQLPRLGTIRLKEHGYVPLSAKILSATISEQAGRWYVSFQVEEMIPDPIAPAGDPIGVDLGIKTLVTCSDGTSFSNPRALKQAQERLRRLERQKARRKQGGKNRQKTCRMLTKLHAHIAHIRQDATHKLTSHLCKNHAVIAIEDLCVAGMLKNHHLAQAVSDSNFGEIRRQLVYKAHQHGACLLIVNRFYPSSKTCSACGWIDEDLTLADRAFACHACELCIDRDLNAAINLLKEALRTTVSSTGNDAYGVGSSGLPGMANETTHAEVGTNLRL